MDTRDGRRDFLKQLALGAGGLWWGLSDGPGPASARRPDALARVPLGDVRLGGRLGRSIDLCVRNRVTAQDSEPLVEPFRRRQETTCWSSEFWGKWFTSAVAAQRYTKDPAALGSEMAIDAFDVYQ
jgi:hypothetical protein